MCGRAEPKLVDNTGKYSILILLFHLLAFSGRSSNAPFESAAGENWLAASRWSRNKSPHPAVAVAVAAVVLFVVVLVFCRSAQNPPHTQ